MNALHQAIEELRTHRDRIEASGPIAPSGVWIEVYRPGGREVDYARLKAEKAMWGKSRSRGLQRVGSADHRDWQQRIRRRDALLEIERRSLAIQAMLDAPIWEP
ncbi:hypothetical protein [Leptolyngbya sp. PCC 6406]|uniref:hypothetical protein n=1 Tax=Leptolyngbya sp. PCC 6406 TaxID=1173264 RepID=UPI0002AC8A6C|nr:hypothetical protein [Leptolyngbya sp. PCC 6406]